jgi:hypothetical protein
MRVALLLKKYLKIAVYVVLSAFAILFSTFLGHRAPKFSSAGSENNMVPTAHADTLGAASIGGEGIITGGEGSGEGQPAYGGEGSGEGEGGSSSG